MCVTDTLIICYSCQALVSPIFYAAAAKLISTLSFMEVQQYSALNIAMFLKYVMELSLMSSWDCPI